MENSHSKPIDSTVNNSNTQENIKYDEMHDK